MKLKIRLKSFYRHNKHCFGMWCCFIELIFAALPPYGINHTVFLLILALMWLIVWKRDRRIDTLERMMNIFAHKSIMALRMQHEFHLECVMQLKSKANESAEEMA